MCVCGMPGQEYFTLDLYPCIALHTAVALRIAALAESCLKRGSSARGVYVTLAQVFSWAALRKLGLKASNLDLHVADIRFMR